MLRTEKPDLQAVVSYADPLERRTADGVLCKAAHRGQIYQASSAVLAGRAAARTLILDQNGQVVSERALSKIRNGECGHAYAARQLVAAGAPERAPGEEPGDWLARALREPLFRRVRHPGNWAYVFGLDRDTKHQVALRHGGGVPYPRAA